VTVQTTAKSLTAMGITTLDGCLGPAGRHNVSRQAPASGSDRTIDSQIVDRDGNSDSRWLLGCLGPAGRHNVSRQAPASGSDSTNDSQIVDRDGYNNSRWLLGCSGPAGRHIGSQRRPPKRSGPVGAKRSKRSKSQPSIRSPNVQ